jgi:hypothetical protein
MIDFTTLQGLTIPEGNVKSISRNGVLIWEKGGSDEPVAPTYTNQLTIAQAIDSTDSYNGVGYRTGYYLTSSGTFESAGKATEWMTGCIPYTIDKSIYIRGVSFTTASHDRMYFFSSKTTRVAPGINSGTTNLRTYFTIEQLGTNYCKLTPIGGSGLNATTQYVRMSFTTGTPSEVIITVDEPIE